MEFTSSRGHLSKVTMVFLIGKNFSFRSGKEHRSLKFSQLRLEPASGNEPEKLIYTSFGEKNNLGGLKHRTFKRKRIEHYANDTCPERCMVNLYNDEGMWMIVVDMIFAFVVIRLITFFLFLVWFTSNPIGHNIVWVIGSIICTVKLELMVILQIIA